MVILLLTNLYLNWIRTRNSGKRTPSTDTEIGTISTKIDAIEKDLEETKERIRLHEDKISRQVGALHSRINDVFGELKEITGMLKTHMEAEKNGH